MSADAPPETADRPLVGWIKMWHPRNVLVSLPVPAAHYAAAFAAVDDALAAGFLAAAPGLEAGEQAEQVGYVLRREKQNADRTETPIIDLYSADESQKFKFLSIYLNRDEDVDAFEHASGMSLSGLSNFPGQAAPERGANKQSDRFIVKAPRPFGVVIKPNPKHNPDEKDTTKMKPKRLFVRWADQKPAGSQHQQRAERPAAGGQQQPAMDPAVVKKWKVFHDSHPPVDVFNAFLLDHFDAVPGDMQERVASANRAHAKLRGWVWDTRAMEYTDPAAAAARQAKDESEIPF